MAERNLAVVHDATAIANTDMFSDKRVEMIRNTVAKGAPDDTFIAFLDIAKRRNLDPLSKQISLIKFGGQYTIITTIDGYRAIAEQTGQYGGSDAPVFTYTGEVTKAGKKAPDTATVTVYKLINGHPYPFSATVYFEEYSTGMNNWSTMPRTMLAKVAESHALRKAFPAVMSGMYEESEMDQAIEGTARVVESPSRPVSQPNPLQRLLDVAKGAGISEEDLELQATAILKKASLEDVLPADLRKLTEAIESRPDNARAFYQDLRAKAGANLVARKLASLDALIGGWLSNTQQCAEVAHKVEILLDGRLVAHAADTAEPTGSIWEPTGSSNTKRRGTPRAPAILDAGIGSMSLRPFTIRDMKEGLTSRMSANHWISRPCFFIKWRSI